MAGYLLQYKAMALAFGTSLLFVGAFMVAERIWPVERGQPLSAVWWNVRSGALHDIMMSMIGATAAVLPTMLQRQLGTGWIDLGLSNPQTILGMVTAAVVYLFLYDLAQYAWHRIEHTYSFAWAWHRIHHSDEHLNASTALRRHWIGAFFSAFVTSIPVVTLFAPIGVSALPIWILLTAVGYWNHANLRISLGPWFISPAYHRVHHSKLSEHQNMNLAGAFPIIDIVFGTYLRPDVKNLPPTGLYRNEKDGGVLAANFMVFKLWIEVLKPRIGK